MIGRLVTLLALSLALASCGNDPDAFTAARAFKSGVTERFKTARPAKSALPPRQITRADLSQILTPVQLVTIEKTGQQAVIALVASNQGVETWSSVDKVTVSFRNGVIVATRGLGADLMSGNAPTGNALQGGSGRYGRARVVLDGLDQAIRTTYACATTRVSGETIEIVEINYQTSHVKEVCTAPGSEFENEYWIDGTQRIRKSRQWISTEVGYLVVQDVRP